MNLDTGRPPFWRTIFREPGFFFGLILPIVVWGMFASYVWRGVTFSSVPEDAPGSHRGFALNLAWAGTAISIVSMLWTAARVRRLLQHGVEAPGTVVSVSPSRVTFSYSYGGREWNKIISGTGTSAVSEYEPGDDVIVLLDPKSPKRCLLRKGVLSKEGIEVPLKPRADRSDAWWQTCGTGLVLLGLAVFFYVDLTRFEKTGGTYHFWGPFALLYGISGKWGIVLILGLLGLAMLYWGVQEFGKGKKKP